jgi:hypothetical protein
MSLTTSEIAGIADLAEETAVAACWRQWASVQNLGTPMREVAHGRSGHASPSARHSQRPAREPRHLPTCRVAQVPGSASIVRADSSETRWVSLP